MSGAARRSIRSENTRGTRGLFRISLACMTVAVAALGGCQKSLFAPEDERSPYDRYDAIRAQRASPYLENEFGQKKPNIRGRLLDND